MSVLRPVYPRMSRIGLSRLSGWPDILPHDGEGVAAPERGAPSFSSEVAAIPRPG